MVHRSSVRRSGLTLAMTLAALAAASPAQAAVFNILDAADPAADEYCATDVATGDVNGDGRDDVAIGCYGSDIGATNAGRVIVFIRDGVNVSFDRVVLTPTSPQTHGFCGRSVAIGDVNGDNRDDVAIGCDGANPGAAAGAGLVLLFRRNAGNTGFEAPSTLVAAAPQAEEGCGGALEMGDFSGDGKADIAAGCEVYDPPGDLNSGRVITFSGASLTAGALVRTAPDIDRCGASVAIGDVTGDNQGDVVAGCWGTQVRGAVVFRSSGGQTMVQSGIVNGFCGQALAVGDVNGDGVGDLAIGCPQVTPPDTNQWSGAAGVWTSTGIGFNAPYWLYPPSPTSQDYCGTSVAVGGVLGDARNDVVIGCSGDDDGGSNAGSVISFQRTGANDGFAAGVVTLHPSAATDDTCGYRTAIGDVNADTGGDIVTGCYARTVSGQDSAGGAFVMLGEVPTAVTNPDPPVSNPGPPAPPAPTPPAPPSGNGDSTPTAVSATIPTYSAIPVNADGSYTSPAVSCNETRCFVLVDPRTSPGALRATASAKKKSNKAKPFAVSAKQRYTLTRGQKRGIRFKLNRKAQALLKKQGKLRVTFTIKVTDPSGNSRSFKRAATLKAQAKTKKTKAKSRQR